MKHNIPQSVIKRALVATVAAGTLVAASSTAIAAGNDIQARIAEIERRIAQIGVEMRNVSEHEADSEKVGSEQYWRRKAGYLEY